MVRIGEQLRAEAWWPQDAGRPEPLDAAAHEEGSATQTEMLEPVRHRGEVLGASVTKKPGDTVDPNEERLIRDLARGIYPPLLADQGLVAALQAQARKAAVPTEVRSDGVGRYPQDTEAAVYFCVLEALQNIGKYAGASQVAVSLEAADGSLRFTVRDDGAGFDAGAAHGSGLTNMRDRLESLGGSLVVRSEPGRGTTVTGVIPVQAAP